MAKPFCTSRGSPTSAPRPYCVGITGSRGVGKSLVGDHLIKRGFVVIDTDHITHDILDNPGPVYEQVLARFGQDCAPVKGEAIDHGILASRAFATEKDKLDLEAILHPEINRRLETVILDAGLAGHKYTFELVPLLHEAGLREYFDEVWCVFAEEGVRLKRVMARDNIDEATARRLIALQMPQADKMRLSDIRIDNSGEKEATTAAVDGLIDPLSKRADLYLAAAAKAKATETGSDQPPTATPGTDKPAGGSKPDGEPNPKPKPSGPNPATEEDNARLREVLGAFGKVGTEEALAKLGNVAGTEHQEANATLTMVVDREGDDGKELSRQLDVEVRMTVRNAPGGSAPPEECSCGCGPRCKISCACKPDCGCKCKKPAPKPDGECGKHGHGNRLWLVVLGLFGLLGFLFACLLLWAWTHPSPSPAKSNNEVKVTVINNITNEKPKDPETPPPPVVEPPFKPPAEPPTPPVTGGKQELDEVPGFAFRFVHNAVRVKVSRWEVIHGDGGKGAQVSGFDADKRLMVYQEYDDSHYMTFQWVISYFPDSSVQVDRFEGRGNIFVGRSVYHYSQGGGLEQAEQLNGLKRQMLRVAAVRNGSGALIALNVEEFDPVKGVAIAKRTIEGPDAVQEFMRTRFFVYDRFSTKP